MFISAYKTPSGCHVIYGDKKDTQDYIDTAGLSFEDFQSKLKEKIAYGLTLDKAIPVDDDEREIPIDIVESHKYVKYMDDGF
jgi:hypothetical protein